MLTLCKYDLRKGNFFFEFGKGVTKEVRKHLFRAANVYHNQVRWLSTQLSNESALPHTTDDSMKPWST